MEKQLMDIKDFIDMFIITYKMTNKLKCQIVESTLFYKNYYFQCSVREKEILKAIMEMGISRDNKIIVCLWILPREKHFIELLEQVYEVDFKIFKLYKKPVSVYYNYEIELENNQINKEWYNEIVERDN